MAALSLSFKIVFSILYLTWNSLEVCKFLKNKNWNEGVSTRNGSRENGIAIEKVGIENKADEGNDDEEDNLSNKIKVKRNLSFPQTVETKASVNEKLWTQVRRSPEDDRSEDQVPEVVTLERIGAEVEELDPGSFFRDLPNVRHSVGFHQTLDQDCQESADNDPDLENILPKFQAYVGVKLW